MKNSEFKSQSLNALFHPSVDAWLIKTVVKYHLINSKFVSKLEILENSINRRTKKRDQDRADSNNADLTPEEITVGVQDIAVASILINKSKIIVPDGFNPNEGFDASQF